MIKQALALVALSIGVIISMSYAQHAVHFLLTAHEWISQILTDVFSGGQAGNITRGLISLLSLPILFAAIPTILYWVIRRSWFPYFMEIVWIIWLIQAGALMVMAKAAT